MQERLQGNCERRVVQRGRCSVMVYVMVIAATMALPTGQYQWVNDQVTGRPGVRNQIRAQVKLPRLRLMFGRLCDRDADGRCLRRAGREIQMGEGTGRTALVEGRQLPDWWLQLPAAGADFLPRPSRPVPQHAARCFPPFPPSSNMQPLFGAAALSSIWRFRDPRALQANFTLVEA